jgi:hypothetical protein
MDHQQPYSHFPAFNCGVDWITATHSYKGVSNPLEEFGARILKEKFPAAGATTAGKSLGYAGRRAEGIFCGRSPQGVLLQLSGPLCTPLAVEAITLATNVSRIDLQVTVFTEGEQCHLATWTWNQLVRLRSSDASKGKLNLIRGHPDGETLEVNRRCSDQFGRLYDKTAEAKLGAPLLLWRYEVEWKGRRAQWVASRLASGECNPTGVRRLVHVWWTNKGVEPAFDCHTSQIAFEPFITCPTRDVLTWMRQSLSITVAKAINKHGRQTVLDALGLIEKSEGGPHNASG